MREFFNPWRRKIGVVTMGLACVATTFWVSSYHNGDLLQIGFGRMHLLHTAHGNFRWVAWTPPADQPRYAFSWMPGQIRADDKSQIFEEVRTDLLKDNIRIRETTISFWTIAVPLTLFSAYLLASKPRQTATKQTTEPLPTDGA